MSGDTYSEVSYDGWFKRIASSFVGALVGIALFLLSFVLLFWNEHESVKVASGLEQAGGMVVTIPNDPLDPSYEGKLVHTVGSASTDETLTDDVFGITSPGIRLVRHAEMYQWKEETKKETKNKLGGGQETITTYSYSKTWSPNWIDSNNFNSNKNDKRERHDNPSWPEMYRGRILTAQKVKLGAHTLPSALVDSIRTSEVLPVPTDTPNKENFKVVDGAFYRGNSLSEPQIGDLRISYKLVKPMTVSVIALQSGDSFHLFKASSGSSVERLEEGEKSSKQMIESAQAEARMFTWLLRLVGYLMMAAGIFLVLNPLKIFANVIPFLGDIVGFFLGIFAMLVAAVLSLITIAIGWISSRPILAFGLLALAGFFFVGLVYFVMTMVRRQRAKAASALPKSKS